MVRTKNPHVGGQQIPLDILPEVDWRPPTDLPDLRRLKRVALDTETKDDGLAAGVGPGWANGRGFCCGVSAAWPTGSIYIPLRHPDTECLDKTLVRSWLRALFESDTTIVFQNGTYDIGWLHADLEVPPPRRIADTVCAAVMVDENRLQYNLDSLCAWRGIPGKDRSTLDEAAGHYCVDPLRELHKLPARYVAQYAMQDTISTLALFESLEPVMREEETLEAFQVEMDLMPLIHEMRRRGVRINLDTAHETQRLLRQRREDLLDELARRLGWPRGRVGIDDLRRTSTLAAWHDDHGVSYPRTWRTGAPSFEKKWMDRHEHWLPRMISQAKQTHEAAEKFIGKFLVDYAHNHGPGHDRLHATINQFRSSDEEGNQSSGTKSHRFSYADPPLQQMPSRNEMLCTAIRGCFEPEDGEIWCSNDYSQQEYRWIVHYAHRLKLRMADRAWQRYHDDPDTDFHKLVAEWTKLPRPQAKDANFAKAYGAGRGKFAEMIGMELLEADQVRGKYDREMPFVQELNDFCKKQASHRGWIKMADGARSHFNTWEVRWLPRELATAGFRDRRWSKLMYPCSHEEAIRRIEGRGEYHGHPWSHPDTNKELVRGHTAKAMNRLIQGGSARQTKHAMLGCWREGIVPLVQMHDELNASVDSEAQGRRMAEIMCAALPMSFPMKVDQEYGKDWGHARTRKRDGVVVYGATWAEAVAEL